MPSRLNKTRESIGGLRAALLQATPETLQAQVPTLQEAVKSLSALTHPTRDEAADLNGLKQDLNGLKQDLAGCSKLIECGLASTRILAGLLASASAGYSPTGEVRPLIAPSRLSLKG